MKYSVTLVAGAAAIVSAQSTGGLTYNSGNNTYTCAIPNGAYCAGDSLVTNIIVRCTKGVGQPGNCNDNLAAEPPVGVSYAPCYQTSTTSGDAACSKNGLVYPASGSDATNNTTPFPAPGGSSSISSSASTASSYAQTVTVSNCSSTTAAVTPANLGNGTIAYGTQTATAAGPVSSGLAGNATYAQSSPSSTGSSPVAGSSGAAAAVDVAAAGALAGFGALVAAAFMM